MVEFSTATRASEPALAFAPNALPSGSCLPNPSSSFESQLEQHILQEIFPFPVSSGTSNSPPAALTWLSPCGYQSSQQDSLMSMLLPMAKHCAKCMLLLGRWPQSREQWPFLLLKKSPHQDIYYMYSSHCM